MSDTLQQTTPKLMPSITIKVSIVDREHFLTGNSLPKDVVEGYIWFAFQNPSGDYVTLYADEAPQAAIMAEHAGCLELAARLRAAK